MKNNKTLTFGKKGGRSASNNDNSYVDGPSFTKAATSDNDPSRLNVFQGSQSPIESEPVSIEVGRNNQTEMNHYNENEETTFPENKKTAKFKFIRKKSKSRSSRPKSAVKSKSQGKLMTF